MPVDISAILSGDRGDVTAEELAELVRLANLAAEYRAALDAVVKQVPFGPIWDRYGFYQPWFLNARDLLRRTS